MHPIQEHRNIKQILTNIKGETDRNTKHTHVETKQHATQT